MGVRQIYLEYLESKGVFDFKKNNVLDIGAQNAYLFSPEYILGFLKRHGGCDDGAAAMAHQFSEGGTFNASMNGFKNDAFLNDLFRAAGISYTSIDVFVRPDNIVADLNNYRVPSQMRGAYTAVLNFGTTEHVFDQRNCFEVIHDATAVGGFMFHQVPAVGCVDHSFFVYSPIFFASMAKANEYELFDLWFSGPYGSNTVFSTINSLVYKELLIDKDPLRDRSLPDNMVGGWESVGIPDGTINVLMRKISDAPFRLPFELSTAIAPSALDDLNTEADPMRRIENLERENAHLHEQLRLIGTPQNPMQGLR